jgi:hypothetical protein
VGWAASALALGRVQAALAAEAESSFTPESSPDSTLRQTKALLSRPMSFARVGIV